MTDLANAPRLGQLTRHDHIHSAFEEWAQHTPGAIAVVQGPEQVTYAELDRRADCLASLLRVHGVRAGDRVGLFLPRSVPMVLGILATLKIGAAYVPQDASSTPYQRLGHIMACARMRVVLTMAEHVGRIPRGKGRVVIALDELALEALKYDGSIPLVTATDHDTDTAVVVFAAGRSGRPNGVAVTHASLCNLLLSEPDPLGLQPSQRDTDLFDVVFDRDVREIFDALSHGETLVIRTNGSQHMWEGTDALPTTRPRACR